MLAGTAVLDGRASGVRVGRGVRVGWLVGVWVGATVPLPLAAVGVALPAAPPSAVGVMDWRLAWQTSAGNRMR